MELLHIKVGITAQKSMIRGSDQTAGEMEYRRQQQQQVRVNTSGLFPQKIVKFTTALLQATNMYYINCFTVRNESRILPRAKLTAAPADAAS